MRKGKSRFLSLMLSGVMAVTSTGIEASAQESVYEVVETETTEESIPTEEAADSVQTEEVLTEVTGDAVEEWEQETQAEEHCDFSVGENGKVTGSNGIFYEDVTYLSVDTLEMLDEDAQSVYISFCDDIASMKENGNEVEDVVIAADDEGNLYWTFSVPGIELTKAQESMLSDLPLVEDPVLEEDTTEETGTEENTSEEALTEEETTEEALTEEESTEEVTTEEETTEEALTEEESTEEETTEEVVTEEETTEEALTEEESTEEVITEEETTEEVISEEELSQEETLTETPLEERVSENMELLADIMPENVEKIEDVYVEPIIDLEYDNVQINSTLPSGNYFYNQLTNTEKSIYNAASGKLTGGSTSFSFQGPSNASAAISQAISAVILTKPAKMDWMDPRGGWSGKGRYSGGSVSWTVTVKKSKYYSSSLESKAKSQIKTLAKKAQEYTIKNYPNAPAYGIVKYFDKWICENNYYNYVGVNGPYEDGYYYCHSSYGILLKGYGVCESYAKALSRLLDSVGIPNVYVVGDAGGGHAWNYVQMPNGNWYMVDSTWNDGGSTSNGRYFLCPNDGRHKATGTYFSNCPRNFKFPSLASSKYSASSEKLTLSQSSCDLQAKKSIQLTCSGINLKKFKSKWSSSNTKVAKVSSSGKVTGVAPGKATIKLTVTMYGVEMSASCNVNVYQVKKVTFDSNGKASSQITCGIAGSTGTNSEAQKFVLNADCGEGSYTAQQLVSKGYVEKPSVKSSNENVATAACSLSGNKLNLTVKPISMGSAKITVKFGGKTVTLNYSVKQKLKADWFDLSEIKNVTYKGKAYTPKVTLKASAPKGVGFKVKHTNNKNAGTASVTISGTGKYGGDMVYTYKIAPINITKADFSACTESKVYNGGTNTATTTVKLDKKKLTAGKDYDVYYNGSLSAVKVGTYTVTIKGKGNYTGTVSTKQKFTITANSISKMKVSCPSSVKYTGSAQNPVVVKIGKNVLPSSDYKVTYHKDTEDGAVTSPVNKGKYVAVITPKGTNVTTNGNKTQIVKKFTIK